MAKDTETKKLPLLSKHNKKKHVKKNARKKRGRCKKEKNVKYVGKKTKTCKIYMEKERNM